MDNGNTQNSEFQGITAHLEETASQRNKEKVLQLFNQDFSVYEEIVAKDVMIHGPASDQETVGIKAAQLLDASYATAYPNAEYAIEDVFAVGDKVVVRWKMKGTQTGVRKGLRICGKTQDILPTGCKISLNGIHIYRFNSEGQIVESWAMRDRLGEIEQITDISIVSKSSMVLK